MLDLVTFRKHALAGLVAFAGLLVLHAPDVRAERVTDVRIGRHGEYTRVVIELDGPSGYKLERLERPGEAPEILVKVDASSAPRELASQSDVVKSVKLESKGEGSVARIVLRSREIRLAEMKLTAPSRIVLDVRKASGAPGEDDVAARFSAPATTPTPAAPAIVAQAPAAKPAKKQPLEVPKTAPATPPPLPATVEAELEAVARGENVLDEEVEAVRGAPKKAAQEVAKTPPPVPAAEPGLEAPLGEPAVVADAGMAKQAASDVPGPGAAARAQTPPPAPSSASGAPAPGEAPPAGDTAARSAAPAATAAATPPAKPVPSLAPTAPVVAPPPVIEEGSDPTLWLGAAVIALGLVLAWRILAGRRRAADPDALAGIPPDAFDDRAETDEDTQIGVAEVDDGAADVESAASPAGFPVPATAAGADTDDADAPRTQSSLFDEDAEDDPDAKPDAEAPTIARRTGVGFADEAPTIARVVAVEDDLPGVPGVASQAVTAPIVPPLAPVQPLETAQPAHAAAAREPFATAAPIAPAPSAAMEAAAAPPPPRADDEVLRLVRELERRLTGIEQRLAQTAESRERIERQIVAQTEELRVQRAAIARTQRVLRTLARPEDLASEPAPRGPAGGN